MQSSDNTSAPNFEALMNYLKSNMENYPEGTDEREIILLLFALAYKKSPIPLVLFRNWSLHTYSKNYTPAEALALCENFIKHNLNLDMDFAEAVNVLKVNFLKTAH